MGKTLTGVIIKLLSSKINLNSSSTRGLVPFASMYKVNKPANFKNSEFLKESGIIQFPGSKSEFYKLELLNPADKFQFYKYNSSISNDSYNLKNSGNFLEEKVSLVNKSFTLNTNPFLPEVQMKSLDSMDYLENVIWNKWFPKPQNLDSILQEGQLSYNNSHFPGLKLKNISSIYSITDPDVRFASLGTPIQKKFIYNLKVLASGTDFTVENPQAGLNTDIILRRGDESIFIDVKMLRLPPIQKVNSGKLEFYKFENLSDMLDFTRVENIVNSAISSGIKSPRPVIILAIDTYPMPELLNKVSIAQSEINNVILPLIFDKLKVPFKVYFYFVGPHNSESSVPILDVLSFNMLLLNEFNGINHLYTKDLSNSHF